MRHGWNIVNLSWILERPPLIFLRTSLACHLNHKSTTLNRVDKDVPRLEVRIAGPCPQELNLSTTSHAVVLGIDIEETSFTDTFSGGIAWDGTDIEDSHTCTVAGLVRVAINYILVVINRAVAHLVVASDAWVAEITDVDDICGCETLHWSVLNDGLCKM